MKLFKSLFYLLLPLMMGIFVGLIINGQNGYLNLEKPFLSPPGFVFPIVWTILYLLMGISYYLINKNYKVDNSVKLVYYIQLIVNGLWSIIFFSLQLRLLSCLWIILLVILITIMINKFVEIDKLSGYLNIPYLFWCLFATYLTIGVYLLN